MTQKTSSRAASVQRLTALGPLALETACGLVQVLEEAASEGVALEFDPLSPGVILGRLPSRRTVLCQPGADLGPDHRLLPLPFGVPLLPLSNLAAQEFVQPLDEAARVGVPMKRRPSPASSDPRLAPRSASRARRARCACRPRSSPRAAAALNWDRPTVAPAATDCLCLLSSLLLVAGTVDRLPCRPFPRRPAPCPPSQAHGAGAAASNARPRARAAPRAWRSPPRGPHAGPRGDSGQQKPVLLTPAGRLPQAGQSGAAMSSRARRRPAALKALSGSPEEPRRLSETPSLRALFSMLGCGRSKASERARAPRCARCRRASSSAVVHGLTSSPPSRTSFGAPSHPRSHPPCSPRHWGWATPCPL